MYCKDCGYWWEDCICDEKDKNEKTYSKDLHYDKYMLNYIKDWDTYTIASKFVLKNEKTKTQIL